MIQVAWFDPTTMTPDAKAARIIEDTPLKAIIREVAAKHRVTYEGLVSNRRARWLAWPRQEAYRRCYVETSASLPEIGRAFGGRNHTTIIVGIRNYEARNGLPTCMGGR